MSIEAQTAERLQAYNTPDGNPFSPEVIDRVAELAGRQASYGEDYGRFLTDAGYAGRRLFTAPNGYPVEVADFRRENEEDGALVYHLPMANPLDPNQLYQISTIAAANPTTRIIAMGNPSGGEYEPGRFTFTKRRGIQRGDFRPLVEPILAYLDEEKVEQTDQVGYSFGADKAAETAATGEVAVSRLVTIEPVVGRRKLPQLGRDFKATEDVLADYVDATGLDGFTAARRDSITAMQYAWGLGRLSSIAIARGLARGEFGNRFYRAYTTHPDMDATLAWGSDSELSAFDSSHKLLLMGLYNNEPKAAEHDPAMMLMVAAAILQEHSRVTDMRFTGERHAMANDVHLQTAIVTQALT